MADMNHITLKELATFAHDLRTPLAAIGGFVQLLELGAHGPVSPAQSGALERVRVNQLLAVTLLSDFMQRAEQRLISNEDTLTDILPDADGS